MTDAPDYGEPWDERYHPTTGRIDLVRSDGHVVGYLGNMLFSRRQRVLKCVNACRGIHDPETVVPLLVEAIKSMPWVCGGVGLCSESQKKLDAAFAALQPKREG